MNDLIVRALSVGTGGKRAASPPAPPSSANSKLERRGGGYGYVDGMDNIEEGEDTETIELHASAAGRPMPTPSAPVRQRVNIGRKKMD